MAMKLLILFCVLVLAGCGVQVEPTVVATATPTLAATATATITFSPIATATVEPTVTPTSSPTTTSTATAMPSATPTATAAPLAEVVGDLYALQYVLAGVQVMTISEMERDAAAIRAGEMEQVPPGKLLGMALGLNMVDEELARRAEAATDAPAWLAGYTERIRENTVALGTVIGRWMRGETTSATIQAELAPVRSACEWALSDLLDELKRAGVSQVEIDALEAQVLDVMEAE